uniref:Uncharacterized protein n=2 Tax=viral metagenome TaxID=1070528 RepID=A0A6M3XW20_9ZZZZ
MQATETDFEFVQPQEIVDGQLDGIAGGIMDLMEDPDPNSSGAAVSKPATEVETEKEETEEETPEKPAGEEPDTYTIKWQGQDKEVTQEELMNLAQQGFDYTQKTQALAQERDQLAGVQGLATLLRSDPVKAAQIAAIISGQTPQKEPEKPQFDDPIEQLKWETKQEVLADFRKEMQQNIGPLHRQSALSQIKAQIQTDPDYQEVHGAIMGQVMALPGADELAVAFREARRMGQLSPDLSNVRNSLAKNVYLQLDQDPATYMEMFQHFKTKKATALEPVTTAKVVKKETKAPFLDTGGVASVEGVVGKERTQRLTKQKASALRSGDPLAIADWLQDSGAINHLY